MSRRHLFAWNALAAALALTLMLGCERHRENEAEHISPASDPSDIAMRLQPGPEAPEAKELQPRGLPVRNPYEGDLLAIQQGHRLYEWMNCIECHGEGGGSIGPTLWDDQWRYGGRGIDLAESILYGRPNGMPRFVGHLPVDEVWKIVAYLQSMEPEGGFYMEGVK